MIAFLLVLSAAWSATAQAPASPTRRVLERLTFTRISGSGSDWINAITTDRDGNVIVAGTTSSPDLPTRNGAQLEMGESQVMRSIDNGVTWTKLARLPEGSPSAIQAHPALPNVVFVWANTGIYKSSDGGQTWRSVYKRSDPSNVVPLLGAPAIAIDPSDPSRIYTLNPYVPFGGPGMLTSRDGGETFQQTAFSSGPVFSLFGSKVQVDPRGSGTVLALAQTLMISLDRGQTWTPRQPPTSFLMTTAVFDPHHSGVIYLAAAAGVLGRLYRSGDWGMTWTEKRVPSDAIVNLFFDPDRPDVMYAASLASNLHRSDDGGVNWVRTGPSAPSLNERVRITALPRSCGGGGLIGGGARSPDYGTTWIAGTISGVQDTSAGAGCSVYAVRAIAGDAYVSKLAPDGEVLWSTYIGETGGESAGSVVADNNGNVYVGGTTTAGYGSGDSWIIKFDAAGRLLYTKSLGPGSAPAIALDASGNVYAAGRTFGGLPFHTSDALGGPSPYVAKLSADGSVQYVSAIEAIPNPVPGMYSIAADSQGTAVVVGTGAIVRVDSAGHVISSDWSTPYSNAVSVAIDAHDNVYFTGSTSLEDFPVSALSMPRSRPCGRLTVSVLPLYAEVDVYVVKLKPDGSFDYSARITGECWSNATMLRANEDGVVTVALQTQSAGFPLRNPVAGPGLTGSEISAAVMQLSADGSSLLFSSYLESSESPQIAVAPDGSLYAGVNSINHASVLKLPNAVQPKLSIHSVGTAFSGTSMGIVPRSLVAIHGQNLGPAEPIDTGLAAEVPRGLELVGVRVLFDGVPATMVRVASEQILCIAPAELKDTTAVQVAHDDGLSNEVQILVRPLAPQLLARDFPDADQHNVSDAVARNEDGTENDFAHPASAGSSVTVYVNGLGNPPLYGIYSSLDSYTARVTGFEQLSGFIDGIYEVRLMVPRLTGEGPVQRVTFSLSPSPPGRPFLTPYARSRPVAIYVRLSP